MFSQLKNIDRAFQHIKLFSVAFLLVCTLGTVSVVYWSFTMVKESQGRVYILYNGKMLEAFGAQRRMNMPVELRDHIRTFHSLFFTLDPDEKAIAATVGKALYLADGSAKSAYDNLREAGYYNNLISANISQKIEVDSIQMGNEAPYPFTCYATQKLIRSSSTVLRKLVTRGRVRVLDSQTDHNPHGFLIEGWETLVNTDVGKGALP
ncbi:conjugative transposon protein TraK [Pedobacter paludis]|uniref:Conjugative transposon protein TraK n=1 Tax=Pedobacter paludis TaxID=2203212 RepID=A0A317F702_9SPHI|nr:conjugative transposon protein TraK [Pedobacter paludis]PWS33326.1 conjugative transposon protein TraK [Pedobacter paludis]